MKKITSLRGILPLLLAVWGMLSASAQTVVFEEDFSSVTKGNSTNTSNGSNTAWSGNSNFSGYSTVYQAGGAIRIGKSGGTGYVKTKALDLSANGGKYTVSFDVKGWTSVEGNIVVTPSSGEAQTVSYTNTVSDGFETKTLEFTGGTSSTTIKIATSKKRAYLDNIRITQETGGSSVPVVSSPTISPDGGNLAIGAAVTISCETDGATIYYAIDAANPETATGTVYSAPLTINSDCAITAWAEKDGMTASARVTKSFKAYAEVDFKKANEIISGQKYIFYANGNVAQPLSGNYGYLQTEAATDNEGVVTQLATLNAFTFTAVTGGYTIQDEAGKYYYQNGTYDSFNVSATAPTDGSQIWSVERQPDGTFVIMNTLKNKFVQFTTYNTYGAYADLQAGSVLPVLYTNGEVGNLSAKEVQTLAFSESEVYVALGAPFTAPVLSGAMTEVTYSSNNTDVATVDAAGNVTIKDYGTAVITAEAEGTDAYYSASAEYRIVVYQEGIIWSEDFTSNDLSAYTIVDGGSDTKLYNEELAGGTAPEILIGKSTGSMEVNIGSLQGLHGRFLLTFNSNNGISAITTTTPGVTIGKITFSKPNGSCEITVPRGVNTLNLKFKNTNKSSNTRVDNFLLVHAGYTLPISQYGYSTFASPRAYVVPAGLEGAIVTVEGNVANTEYVYTEGDIVPAGAGLLYKGTASTSYTIDVADEAATEVYAENCMKGFLQDAPLAVAADTKAYIFANDSEDGLGFYLQGDGSVLNLSYGKAYLSIPATLASQLKGFRLNLGEATGISGVTNQEAETGVYSLSGVRVGNTLNGLPGGVYIVGGKKVIVK